MGCLAMVGLIAVGGLYSMAQGNDKGLTIVASIVSLVSGVLIGTRRSHSN
jgi:hypothetical protein